MTEEVTGDSEIPDTNFKPSPIIVSSSPMVPNESDLIFNELSMNDSEATEDEISKDCCIQLEKSNDLIFQEEKASIFLNKGLMTTEVTGDSEIPNTNFYTLPTIVSSLPVVYNDTEAGKDETSKDCCIELEKSNDLIFQEEKASKFLNKVLMTAEVTGGSEIHDTNFYPSPTIVSSLPVVHNDTTAGKDETSKDCCIELEKSNDLVFQEEKASIFLNKVLMTTEVTGDSEIPEANFNPSPTIVSSLPVVHNDSEAVKDETSRDCCFQLEKSNDLIFQEENASKFLNKVLMTTEVKGHSKIPDTNFNPSPTIVFSLPVVHNDSEASKDEISKNCCIELEKSNDLIFQEKKASKFLNEVLMTTEVSGDSEIPDTNFNPSPTAVSSSPVVHNESDLVFNELSMNDCESNEDEISEDCCIQLEKSNALVFQEEAADVKPGSSCCCSYCKGNGDDIEGIAGKANVKSGLSCCCSYCKRSGDNIDGQGDNIDGYGDNIDGYGDNIDGQGDNIDGYGDNIDGYGDNINTGNVNRTESEHNAIMSSEVEDNNIAAGPSSVTTETVARACRSEIFFEMLRIDSNVSKNVLLAVKSKQLAEGTTGTEILEYVRERVPSGTLAKLKEDVQSFINKALRGNILEIRNRRYFLTEASGSNHATTRFELRTKGELGDNNSNKIDGKADTNFKQNNTKVKASSRLKKSTTNVKSSKRKQSRSPLVKTRKRKSPKSK